MSIYNKKTKKENKQKQYTEYKKQHSQIQQTKKKLTFLSPVSKNFNF